MQSRRALALAARCSLGFLLIAAPCRAQDTTAVQPDSAPTPRTVPTDHPAVPAGPLPPGSRVTFTRDSLVWATANTLADLLTAIPGVYVARAGFLGLPEYVHYAGRGGAALEVLWDGVPLEPLGSDSLSTDPGRIPLSYLQRVDVEVLPALLRVHLVSDRHERLVPRSLVRIMSGAFSTGAYVGIFQQRWPSGIALNLAGDFMGTDGASGTGRSDQRFDLWAKLGWYPSDRVGVTYQLRRQSHNRDPVSPAAGGIAVPESDGARTDVLLTLSAGTAPAGMGLQVDAGFAASSWSSDSGFAVPDQQLRQASLALRYATATWSAEVRGRVADARTPYHVEGRVGWVALPGLVVSGDAAWRRHAAARTSSHLHGAVGLYRGPLAVVGEVTRRDAVPAPALRAEQPIQTTDRGLRVALETDPLGGQFGIVRRGPFRPLPYPDLPIIPSFAPTPEATYVVAAARLRPIGGVTLSGWYSNPLEGAVADLQPPAHGRAEVVLRSKFWRTFRSGAFDLQVKLALESWSPGTAGLDAAGTPIPLPGATFYEIHVQFQIVGFTGFWSLRNARLSRAEYVPGLSYPGNAQTFGVRWEFFN